MSSGRGRGVNNAPAWMSQRDNGNSSSSEPPQSDRHGGGHPPGQQLPPTGGNNMMKDDYGRSRDSFGRMRDQRGDYHGGGGGGRGGGGDYYNRGPPAPWDHGRGYRGGGGGYPPPPPRGGGGPRRGGGYSGHHGRGPHRSHHDGPPPRTNRNRSGIVFHSYEEEREWVEDRRRKRMARPTKWDVLPTPEQQKADEALASAAMQNFAATDFSGAAVDSGLPQQTRHARRLYLGNLPANLTEDELHEFFTNAIRDTLIPSSDNNADNEDPILSVYINHERRFCFLEFKTVEMTTACLALDGINVNGKGKVHMKRPNDYNPLMAPKVHPSKIPQLNVAKLGIIARSVPDGPNKIFVGGLHYHLTEDQVLELLQAFGAVRAFHLVTNDPTGLQSKGYGFVEYADPAQTQVAIMGLNGMDLGGGKILTARIAAARDDESSMLQAKLAAAAAAAAGPSGGIAGGGSSNIVGGYDVEALLDIAMGITPNGGGGPATGGIVAPQPQPAVMPMMMQTGAAHTAAVPGATPLEIANQALEAAFSGIPQQQQPLATATGVAPTRILVLSNMVTDEDLETEQDHAALVDEVRQECAKFGSLTSMQIPRPTGNGSNYQPSAIRKVFLEYATANDALKADRELAGRQFGPNVVETSFFSEEDYLKGDLY